MNRLLCSLLAAMAFLLLAQIHVSALAQSDTLPNGTLPPDAPKLFLPLVTNQGPNPFTSVPVIAPSTARPAAAHGDINLALRSYLPATAALTLIDMGGPTDPDAPQLAALFGSGRAPSFMSSHRVYDWDWSCGVDGCRGVALEEPPVTLVGLAATAGEPLYPPSRGPQIYGGGYVALVLYAEPTRLTLAYTREDSAAVGYLVHLENIRVDGALLQRYRQLDAAGRAELPALRNGERLGSAASDEVLVAIRDTGQFMDPRSRKDWWVGY